MVNRKLGDKDMIVAQQDEVGGRFPVALEWKRIMEIFGEVTAQEEEVAEREWGRSLGGG
jgi:hypothetical protein